MEYHMDSMSKEKISIPYEETINPEIFPWYMLEGVTRFSPFDVFCFYSKEIVPNKDAYNKIILKKSNSLKKNKKSKKILPQLKEPAFKYCYCKKDTGGTMIGKIIIYIECYYGREVEDGLLNPQFECPNYGWMHIGCLSELNSLTEETINSDDFIFACKNCLEKYGEPPKI